MKKKLISIICACVVLATVAVIGNTMQSSTENPGGSSMNTVVSHTVNL